AFVTSILIDRTRSHKELLSKREQTSSALYEIAKNITCAKSVPQCIESVKKRLGALVHGTCEIWVKTEDDKLVFNHTWIARDEKEKATVNWVFVNGKEAGLSTWTLPMAKNL